MGMRAADDAEPPSATFSRAYFDGRYARDPDPWGMATKWYERRKYAVTLAALPRAGYRDCFEPGCGTGELTRLLAPRCERLLAVDFAESAVGSARSAVSEFAHVEVRQATLPEDLPDGRYDLVVVSEILYYLSGDDLKVTLDGLLGRLEAGGDLVVVHCRASDRRHGYDGFNVHSSVASRPELESLVHHEDEEFVLDVFRRSGECP
ncbi:MULTISPECIES: SAM-dependent methyltransferase [unclassified Streptomyces]|uniref:class I SAM-dependent DNA methyltransferase n=1 Tax=unclassified Streptomyces TaxID=2593676 RepID=UPI002DD84FF1|nr:MULTISPECIES: SAM-dependent methyltransferase [unclassified Streptomyces]WSB79092.1 nodulation S family protein [Streptomyces sp. NBC_01775]WSS12708.1 nodulation S family protein [Streptomyces sp. NBC_01186]WSS41491.1 nodulation S family protein [Streptomyces sp. NBC_01187]